MRECVNYGCVDVVAINTNVLEFVYVRVNVYYCINASILYYVNNFRVFDLCYNFRGWFGAP